MPPVSDKPDQNDDLEYLRQQLLAESTDGSSLVKSLKNNPVCALGVDKSIPCVTVVWKRYSTSTQMRFVHEHILRLLRAHRIQAVLGDDTALPTIHAEDQRWIVEDWLPRAQEAGLRLGASKRPIGYFGKLAVDAVQAVAPAGVQLRSFERLEDARAWLRAAAAG